MINQTITQIVFQLQANGLFVVAKVSRGTRPVDIAFRKTVADFCACRLFKDGYAITNTGKQKRRRCRPRDKGCVGAFACFLRVSDDSKCDERDERSSQMPPRREQKGTDLKRSVQSRFQCEKPPPCVQHEMIALVLFSLIVYCFIGSIVRGIPSDSIALFLCSLHLGLRSFYYILVSPCLFCIQRGR